MGIIRRTVLASFAAFAIMTLPSSALAQETTINAVFFTPAQSSYAKSFMNYVTKVNQRGTGVIQIKVRGGPEIMPMGQLGEAQKNGVIDMINCPAGPYLNLVPEGEVFSATNRKPWELRLNGGFALINEIYAKKANAYVLAHVDGGAGFHVFTSEEPQRSADGGTDFARLKIRSAALYREFLEGLGAGVVVQGPGEVYTSLERGLVNANAYTVVGYQGFGWNKFTKYRIDPGFFQTDILISMNKTKWDSLSEAAQRILQEVAIEHERESHEANLKRTEEEGKQMIAAGMKVFELTGSGRAAYLERASRTSWERMQKRDPSSIPALRQRFAN